MGNQIYVGGTLLSDVVSGDVSSVEVQLRETIEGGGGWVTISTGSSSEYRIRVSDNTEIIARYQS